MKRAEHAAYAKLATAGTYLVCAQRYVEFQAWCTAQRAALRQGERDYRDRDGKRFRWVQSVTEIGTGAIALIVISAPPLEQTNAAAQRDAARLRSLLRRAGELRIRIQHVDLPRATLERFTTGGRLL